MSVQRDIAIVGMGCMFPGAADTEHFWSLICSASSVARQAPTDRWPDHPQTFVNEQLTADKIVSSRGCFVDPLPPFSEPTLSGLDTSGLDPLFHLLLHAGHQAWNDAVTEDVNRSKCGVILGQIVLPSETLSNWSDELLARATQAAWGDEPTPLASFNPLNRHVAGLPAGLLAADLGFGGGASCLDAACASSLYAIKLAVDELREGRRDAMLVGGLSRPDSLYTQMGFSHLHALSPTGSCQPFSRRADGLLVGEGAGMIVLKRLEDALRAGDHIYATLPGIGLSNDIGGNLMHPDSEGQLRAMRQAYKHAGWQPESVDLIECHGTGTPTGDRVELASLQQLWSASAADDTPRCVIGSVKSNIGHLLTAAGIAGLIKVLLAMQAKQLPPSANADQPLADLQSTDSRFAILQQAQPWPVRGAGIPRRAAVSAFGFGGINAHVLVEEWYTAPARSVLPAAVRSRATNALPSSSGTSSADAAAQAMTTAMTTATTAPSTATTAEPIAIVGLSGQFGEWTDPASLTARLLGAGEAERASGPRRVLNPQQQLGDAGKGYPLQSINVDSLRFRIPPRELAQLLPQQALMLQTAADALDDAQITTDHDAHLSSGVYIGIELDMNTCNFHWRWQCERQLRDGQLGSGQRAEHSTSVVNALREAATPYLNADRTMGALGGIVASRIARWLGAGAGSFTVSCEQASALKALQIAMRALRRQEINLAVVGGVDLNAEPRGLHAQERLKDHAGIEQSAFGEGAGAVVLKRHSDAVRDGDRIYCVLRGVSQRCAAPLPDGGFAQDDPERHNVAGAQPRAALREHYQLCLDEALADANMQAVQPGLVELSGAQSRSPSALQALTTSIKERRAQSTGSTQIPAASLSDEVLGDSAAASGIASLLRVALCLHYRTLPAAPELSSQGSQRHSNSHSNSNSDTSDQSPDQSYYRPQQSRYWLRNRVEGPRQALLCVDNLIGGTMQVIAEGVASNAQAPVAAVGALLCVYGRDTPALLLAIEQCQSFIAQNSQWAAAAIADHWHQQNIRAQDSLTVSIVATDATQLTALLSEAQACVANKVRAHTTELFFEPQPLAANNGRLAFVFPGSGNHYRGMSQQLSLPAAATLDDNDSRNESSLDQFAGGAFWRDPPVADNDHTKLLCSQIWSSTFVYDIFRHLGVRAEAMIGYSLGETASLFASGCWPDRDTMLARIRDTDLFTKHLGSGFAAVRKHWGLQDAEPVDWRVAMVQAPVSAVREALAGAFADQRVYLLIINTAKECVLGGDGATLARLASELGVVLHPISGVTSVHCEVLQPVADAYRELHLQRTSAVEGLSHYSCHLGQRYEVNRESAADSILGMALQAFDFNTLIETAYADGVRLFVETGPGDACTRMIDDILGERPHLACSASHSRGHEYTQLLRALAGITAHGVTLPIAAWTQHHALIDRRKRKHQQLTLAPGLDCWRVPQRAFEATHSIASGAVNHVYAGADELDSKHTHLQADLRARLPSVAIAPTTHAAALAAAPRAANEQWSAPIVHGMLEMLESRHQAHQAFLQLQNSIESSLSEAVQLRLSAASAPLSGYSASHLVQTRTASTAPLVPLVPNEEVMFDRDQCLRFAIGGIAEVLGVEFADIDQHPTRVRLPDEPLMLVDRIITIEGQAGSLGPARIVTEHDIHAGAWYLDGGRIPTCIAVEAGQADLFLSAWLGIDRVTQGNAVYRLLDANITFHDQMPGAGARIRYDIRINRFFTLGATHLFQFEFDASVDGHPLLTMRDGSAGFFTAAELAAGQGIVDPKIPLAVLDSDAVTSDHNTWLAPSLSGDERYSNQQMDALRDGDLGACFGAGFDTLAMQRAETLPNGRMRLVHRVVDIQAPHDGQPGRIIGEADIHPDDWFLTCHFIDDQVMPGTLMYECCLHTLRIYLLRMGWVGEQGQVAYQSVPGVCGKLKCRGQVIASTRTVRYQISIIKTDFMDDGTPYAIANALMLADGHPIVEMHNMSLSLQGLRREHIEALWHPAHGVAVQASQPAPRQTVQGAGATALFDHASILAYAEGRPSDGFGERYRMFDEQRVLARLPRPPYLFMDQVDRIAGCEQWQLSAGGEIESTHQITAQDWYFSANRQHAVPLAILMEIALQPCGWLAAYLGSALTSETDLSFRNLDGKATLHRALSAESGLLRAKTRINKVSSSGGMIIQTYSVTLHDAAGLLYECETVFGFFSKTALAQQIGVREAQWYAVENVIASPSGQLPYPAKTPFPDAQLRMLDQLSVLSLTGGRHGLGWVEGHAQVDPQAWYFQAHFYQDPVIPGSLGIESMAQLLKVYALERWSHLRNNDDPSAQFQCPASAIEMRWTYRGQVVPSNDRVSVQIHIARVDSATSTLFADGYLAVDGRIIYSVENLSLSLRGGA